MECGSSLGLYGDVVCLRKMKGFIGYVFVREGPKIDSDI